MCASADALFLPCAVSGSLQGPVACAGTVGELAESAPSWRIYRQEFLRTMAFGEWETYDHPVACESIPISGVNLRTLVQICSRESLSAD